MARSISFVIDNTVDTRITITEQADGTLKFEIDVLETGAQADLRGLFFDMGDFLADDALRVTAASGYEDTITDSRFDEAKVVNMGKGNNLHGRTAAIGLFDGALSFGTPGKGKDKIEGSTFVLSSVDGPLSLDMFDVQDIGLRFTSIGPGGDRGPSPSKVISETSGVARNDTLIVTENEVNNINLLANDTYGATNMVTAVYDGDGAFTPTIAGFQRVVVVDGRELGVLLVAMDGTATFDANGADVDAIALGETMSFGFGYSSTAVDGAIATADVILTVVGENDRPVTQDVAATTGEDDLSVSGAFVGSDLDVTDVLSFDILSMPTDEFGNQYGTVVNNGDGTFTFFPGDQFQFLEEGETRDVTFDYVAIDDSGADDDTSLASTVTITVEGAYDAPIVFADELIFVTEDQSMWASGPAIVTDLTELIPDLPFLGLTWDDDDTVTLLPGYVFDGDFLEGFLGGLEAVGQAFADAGCEIASWFGGCDDPPDIDLPSSISTPSIKLQYDTSGQIGLQPYFTLTTGDVDSTVPVDVTFTTPRQVEVGETFTIGTTYDIGDGATYSTHSPGVTAGLDFIFDFELMLKLLIGSSSFGGSTSVNIVDIDIDETINLFSLDSATDLNTVIDLPFGSSLELNFPTIETTGTKIDDNSLESSGSDDVAVLDVDVDALVSLIPYVPPFGFSESDDISISVLGEGIELVGYNISFDAIAVNLIATLSAIQDFTMDIGDLPLMMLLEDGSSISGYQLGNDVTVTTPVGFDADTMGDMDGEIDFEVVVDVEAIFSSLTTLGFDLDIFLGLLRASVDITSDLFDDVNFSLFPIDGIGQADGFLWSETYALVDDLPLATLWDSGEFDLEGFNSDSSLAQFDVA